jgi:CO/xanthine dehydrogenase Mo-binding subunit/aerobic-type carbon monoxide dehydrogenase small subunit (CoxS/CutS family)
MDVIDDTARMKFSVNGIPVISIASKTTRLSDVLREELGIRDVKIGCNAGDCGACTVLLDGLPVCACVTAVAQVVGRQVETLAGLSSQDPVTARLQQSFLRNGAAQCGICTPGMLVSATSLLRNNAQPTETEVQDALGGVLCRCTGYRKIIDAVMYRNEEAGPSGRSTVAATLHNNSPLHGKVGDSIPRLDGEVKVTGCEQFGDDVAPADSLSLRVIRSPYHHARFTLGDLDMFIAEMPGLELILTAGDVPGVNLFGVIPPYIDQPVFAEHTTHYKGEAVAAVVGSAQAIAAFDPDSFPVFWIELAAILSAEAAMAPAALAVHEGRDSNVMCSGLVQRGDAESAFTTAAVSVEGNYETGFIEHAYIEPEAGYARRVGERIEIHGCTQSAYLNRGSIAQIMGLDPDAVRVVPTAVGGGFGAKLDLSFQPFIALAAWRLNRPVRITYSRQESMQSTTKRHPSRMHVKVAADENGKLCAMSFKGYFNTGAYASWGPTVANRVPVHASGPYTIPDYYAKATGVHTHCAPSGAFRGFGVPQAAIAQESLFDELALKLDMDRLEFRLLNALDNHMPTVTGQVFDQSVGIKDCLESLRPHWQQAMTDADEFNQAAKAVGSQSRRGVGVASGWYGCGNTSLPNPSTIKVGIKRDGTLYLHQGAIDIGQGSTTVITQIFADVFGISVELVRLIDADTDATPDAGKTSASRQTFVSGNAARLAAESLRRKIMRLTNSPSIGVITLKPGKIIVTTDDDEEHNLSLSRLSQDDQGYVICAEESYDPPTRPMDENGQGEPYALYGYAAQMVELNVDTGLGTVDLLGFVAAHDVGKAINPLLVEGQIQGGVAQGVGLALMEEFMPGRTENLHDYLIPTMGDIPPIESIIIEVADPHGPFGAKGLGEHVLIPTAPAILNAIHHASGARVTELPATPERVLAGIRRTGEG